jgi:hypothetical protein
MGKKMSNNITTKKLVSDLKMSEEVLTDIDLTKLPSTDISSSSDYTAFEVYPTNEVIKAGEKDYKVDVNPCMKGYVYLESYYPQDKCNIVIDWGDNTVEDIRYLKSASSKITSTTSENSFYVEQKGAIYSYRFLHIYENPGRYIVKITGDTYYCFRTAEQGVINSIVSKVLTSELPIASCVTNIASGFTTNTRLQKIEVPKYCNLSHLVNITAAFSSCNNLLTVSGLSYNFGEGTYTTNGLFSGCSNLNSSDFKIPKSTFISSGVAGIYSGNRNLAINVVNLLPDNGFSDKYVNVSGLFNNCSKLTCSDYEKLANILWNDTSKIWLNTSNCFKKCSDELRSYVPVSWGGTKS